MSALIYLASDSPLKSIEYQQEKWLSINEALEHTAEMEIWHIWLGSSYPPPHIKRTKLPIHALDTDTIKRLDELTFSTQSPLTGSITIPKDWELSEEDIAQDTQYCYVIVRDP
ncbi:MAG: hypothetical protein K2P45_13255 [Eubacterium sp.]|nr:hypothetical protein [Eubacterium sp.]